MKVTNINGTSENSCSCGSWLKHWENFNKTGQKSPNICPACNSSYVEVGAHVQKYGSPDKSWYRKMHKPTNKFQKKHRIAK